MSKMLFDGKGKGPEFVYIRRGFILISSVGKEIIV